MQSAENTEHNIELLNDLIETTIDSVDGYEKAASVADQSAVSTLFRQFADDRRQALMHLREQVRKLGGKPEEDGSILAGAHRSFLELRSYLQSDKKAAIMEVERGEDHIKTQFEDALDDPDLTSEVRDTISACYNTVLRGHDAVSNLKQALNS